jgi:hypothetical protein
MAATLPLLGALGGTTADAIWVTWMVLAVASAGYVAYDAFTQNPELTVMKWGWVLVTLYIGPIGAALYVLSCKEPSPGHTKHSWHRCGSSRSDPPSTASPVMPPGSFSPRS